MSCIAADDLRSLRGIEPIQRFYVVHNFHLHAVKESHASIGELRVSSGHATLHDKKWLACSPWGN